MNLRFLVLSAFLLVFVLGCSTDETNTPVEEETVSIDQTMYFPLIDGSEWEVRSATALEWHDDKVDALYDFLEEKNTKGFVLLKGGRIVLEQYFDGHTQNTKWTWFSAAKSLTAVFVGVAQDEGVININNKSSDYLGANWSQLNAEKQDLITVKHHLSMTTGLKDNVGNYIPWICTEPICLEYTADAGARWAYHQGAFMLLQKMISNNAGMSFQSYCKAKIADKIGMNGNWTNDLGLNIYHSTTRDMARFGLLALNKGSWDNSTIVSKAYFNEMTNTSQELNKSYGYLWWLNGKESYMGTNYQDIFNGSLIPNAPSDMFAALGAGDQKIYVVPSKNIVVVRSGNSAGNEQLGPSSFDDQLWAKINEVIGE